MTLRLAALIAVLSWKAAAASAMLDSRAETTITLPRRGEIRIFDFRPDSALGWKILKATLFLHLESGEPPRQLEVSTVTLKWTDGSDEAKDSVFGKSGSVHRQCSVTVLKEGWVSVDLPPVLVEAHTKGASFGYAIEQGARKFHGRRPVFQQPYILVEGNPPAGR